MANSTARAVTDQVGILFGVGTCAGLTDGELLERFLTGPIEGGDLAFEALVTRHGPMVMSLCRNLLDDPNDAHDAFQAVFLVLARRGGAIRNRQSIVSWLYGVALRVAARARAASIRRHIRDRRTNLAAQAIAAVVANQQQSSPSERNDGAQVVHQEVSRLPEKYRAPIVLCYFEGLTQDEAAFRLSWPVGTVRSRLARARDTLRARLTRRGVTAPAAIGPMASWISGDTPVLTGPAATVSSGTLSNEVSASIVRTVSRLAVGPTSAATAAQSAALLLAQGVLKSMMLKKVLIAVCALMPLGLITIGGGSFLAQKSRAQNQRQPAAAPPRNEAAAVKKDTPKRDDIDPLLQQLLEAARKRYDAQKAYYKEGRITIDRFVDASNQLELAELRIAKNDDARLTARQRHIDRIMEIEKRERSELEAGRSTIADLAEVYARRVEAQLDMKISRREAEELVELLRRVSALERKVEQLQKERAGK